MGRRFTLLDANGALLCVVGAADDSMLLTNVLRKRADSLASCAAASLVTGSGDGEVTYTSKYGGIRWNGCTVEHTAGPTGPGNESRPLGVTVTELVVTVAFGTDSGGNSIIPIANQVADLINNDPEASDILVAAAGGAGTSQVAALGATPLAGGLDNGDYLKFEGIPPMVCRINLVEIV